MTAGRFAKLLTDLTIGLRQSAPMHANGDMDARRQPALDTTELIGQRLRQWIGDQSHADVARAIGMSAETVRRQVKSGRPSALLVQRLSERCGLNAHWLLLGEGHPMIEEDRGFQIASAPIGALLTATATAIASTKGTPPENLRLSG
jgi:hypothetical protein